MLGARWSTLQWMGLSFPILGFRRVDHALNLHAGLHTTCECQTGHFQNSVVPTDCQIRSELKPVLEDVEARILRSPSGVMLWHCGTLSFQDARLGTIVQGDTMSLDRNTHPYPRPSPTKSPS